MSEEEVTLSGLIRAHPADTFDETVKAVADALKLSKLQRAVLWPLLSYEVRRMYRNALRLIEPRHPEDETNTPGVDPAAIRAEYLHGRFTASEGHWVTWGEATVVDHQARIETLSKLRLGITRTIEAHEHAIEQIVAAGVECLNDLATVAPGDEAVA